MNSVKSAFQGSWNGVLRPFSGKNQWVQFAPT